MKIHIKKANINDKNFILYANKMIDRASFIKSSNLKGNIDKDLFMKEKCVCLIAKCGSDSIGMIMFSKVYWADRGQGIYVSQVFVEKEYRQKGVLKLLIQKALKHYRNVNFFTCLVSRRNKKMISCMNKLHCQDEGMITYVVNINDVKF